MSLDPKWLLLNCIRPNEPTFVPKCDKKVYVDAPDNFMLDRYKPIGRRLHEKYSKEASIKISIPRIIPPDVGVVAGSVKKRGGFSLFIPSHREVAGNLITMFMQSQAAGEFMALVSAS